MSTAGSVVSTLGTSHIFSMMQTLLTQPIPGRKVSIYVFELPYFCHIVDTEEIYSTLSQNLNAVTNRTTYKTLKASWPFNCIHDYIFIIRWNRFCKAFPYRSTHNTSICNWTRTRRISPSAQECTQQMEVTARHKENSARSRIYQAVVRSVLL